MKEQAYPTKMIEISDKKVTHREAEAMGRLHLNHETIKKIKSGDIKKGDPLQVAEIAGILAVKKTPDLLPLCHPIPITSAIVESSIREDFVEVKCRVTADYKTGVEMEALTGVSIALLTVWDMVKYLEKDEGGQYPNTGINNVCVVEKVKN
jgi:cyclic pyranopterin phosphate synthase